MAGVLFVHSNFPGQFGYIAHALHLRGERVIALGSATTGRVTGIPIVQWSVSGQLPKDVRPLMVKAGHDLMRAEAARDAALALKSEGFEPDVIVGHPGWGETLFLKEVWPEAKLILHAEYFYHSRGADVGFDLELEKPDILHASFVTAKNATLAWAYSQADALVSPTPFQASLLPKAFRDRVNVIHEGVDLERIRPRLDASVEIDGRTYDSRHPFITFASRVFEPLRGCHVFFRALPRVLEALPDVRVLMIGRESGKGYGTPPPKDSSWKQVFWNEVAGRIDPARVQFAGWLPHEQLNALMGLTTAHVYLTYPFVLSWSLLEAMAAEALVIGSDTAPVRDVITHDRNGVLVDFFRPDLLADTLIRAVRDPEAFRPLRQQARMDVLTDYDRETVCLPRWLDLIDRVRTGAA